MRNDPQGTAHDSSTAKEPPGRWREFSDDRLDASLRAALELFAAHGYHGTSIRMIADAAGLSVPGLYHHYPSKNALLETLVTRAMGELLEHSRVAAAEAGGSPTARFDNIVEALCLFHMSRRRQAFVASTEMRSMPAELRKSHVRSRDIEQSMLADAIADGVAEGTFDCASPQHAARAISSLCVSIASWYRSDGPLSPEQIVDQYLGYCRRIAGADHGAD
ncbi:TetR/AcrR family transcriptional regulator [Dietzia sp.]|uniref:TetR/AcrR family transcriptional regulator n=1 Tax=Dietzia sp. TaxID=1871616 RepID=UPI002FD9A292